jgi:PPE-repeat protein
MIRRLLAFTAVVSLFFGVVSFAMSQGFGGSSAFRGGGMGSSGLGSSGFGSGFGSSGFGGMGSSGFGGSGFGSSGFGGGGFGGGGMGNSGFGGGGFGNSGFGNSGFGGSSGSGAYGGAQNFVGRDASDMQAAFGQMGRAGTQFFNTMNRNMSRNSSRHSTKTVENQPQPMRVEVHVAFDAPRPSSTQLATTVREHLTSILANHKMSQPNVTMQGDTAVITGVAAGENERDVISQLISLEPGIRDVRNEMTVAAPAIGAPSGLGPGR